MKRTISIILAVMLTMTFSLNTYAISINHSFKGTLTELDSDEYLFSFGKLGEDENPSEVGFKIGGKKYTLNDVALYKAQQSKTFGIGFQDNENFLGDSYDIIPYYIDENGIEKNGEIYTVNKSDFADEKAGVKLASISVNGTPLSFFKETVKTYDYGISYEDMEVNNPTVTAVAKDIIDYLAEGHSIQLTLDADVAEGALVGVASYVNGEWLAALECINNGDGTITVVLPAICPVGIFVEGEPVAPEATPEAGEPVEGEPTDGECKICRTFFPYLGAAPLFHGVCIICFVLILAAVCVASYIFYRIMKKEEKKDK